MTNEENNMNQIAGQAFLQTMNYAYQSAASAKERAYGERMAKWQYEMNRKSWEETNEYNKPINQQKRLQEAGLNPHLMYGQGTVGNTSDVPHFEARKETTVPAMKFDLPEVVGVINGLAQIRKTNVETSAIEQEKQYRATQQDIAFLEYIKKASDWAWLNDGSFDDMNNWRTFTDENTGRTHTPGSYAWKKGSVAEYNASLIHAREKLFRTKEARERGLIDLDFQKGKSMRSQDLKRVHEMALIDSRLTNQVMLNKWLDLKLSTFAEKGINIDKDEVSDRMLSEIVGASGSLINKYAPAMIGLLRGRLRTLKPLKVTGNKPPVSNIKKTPIRYNRNGMKNPADMTQSEYHRYLKNFLNEK